MSKLTNKKYAAVITRDAAGSFFVIWTYEQRKLLDECSQVIERAITNDVIVSRKLYHAFGSLLKRLRGEPAQEKADEIKRPVEA